MNTRRQATADRERRIKVRRPGASGSDDEQTRDDASQAAAAVQAGADTKAPGSAADADADPDAAPGAVAATNASDSAATQVDAGAEPPAPAAPKRTEGSPARSGRKRLPTRVPAGPQVRSRAAGRAASRPKQPAREVAAPEVPVRRPEPPAPPQPPPQESLSGLSARLMALARMIQIGSARSGRDGFSQKLLTDAEEVLARAGDRMRLSSSHTVVVLAGGTGSGKSSLFNKIAGADFSTVGVTRPVTVDAHACVWGDAGSGAILDWLGVPARYRYSRASALDSGEDDLAGLVLLDLPDHDSVMNHARNPGRPAGQHGRRHDLGARPAEVRRRRGAPAVPRADGRPLGRARRGAEPGRPARA